MKVETILGTMVMKVKEQGVPVPTLETLYALVLVVEQRLDRGREGKEDN